MFEIDPDRLRLLVKQITGKEISTVQASNFLDLFGEKLNGKLTLTFREFIKTYFGE